MLFLLKSGAPVADSGLSVHGAFPLSIPQSVVPRFPWFCQSEENSATLIHLGGGGFRFEAMAILKAYFPRLVCSTLRLQQRYSGVLVLVPFSKKSWDRSCGIDDATAFSHYLG